MKTPMRSKRAYAWRHKKSQITNPLLHGDEFPTKEFRCERCGSRFPDFLARCPECGSTEWEELAEVNPYTRMPMESFLKACGHLFWLLGTAGFLAMLWQTGDNPQHDHLYLYGAVVSIVTGVLFSAFFFAQSEILRRILRMQRRLRAFHDTYRMTRVLTFAGKVRRLRRTGRPDGKLSR
jgi:Predicted ATP-dependent serine protease